MDSETGSLRLNDLSLSSWSGNREAGSPLSKYMPAKSIERPHHKHFGNSNHLPPYVSASENRRKF